MTITTRTHGRCAVDECPNPGRRALIRADAGRWHLVHGLVHSQQRGTFVVHSWAEACDEHQDTVAAAVRVDTEGWHDHWKGEVGTYDYGSPEGGGTVLVADGLGVDQSRLF